MPLILAIESDRRQAARISALTRDRLANVDLVVAHSAEDALQALARSTPDLILTPQLLSPKDEAALDERLRQLDAAGSHVQTLMIPVLASSGRRAVKKDGLLGRFRRSKETTEDEGCDPAVFAAQIQEYLSRGADDRPAPVSRDVSLGLDAIPEIDSLDLPENAPAPAEEPAQTSAKANEPLPWLSLTEAWPAPAAADAPPVEAATDEISWSGIDDPLPAIDDTSAPNAAANTDAPATPADVSSFLDAMSEPARPPVAEPERGLWEILELDDMAVHEGVLKQAPAGFDPASPIDLDEGPEPETPSSDLYAEFVNFDELSVVDLPPATLGEIMELSDGLSSVADTPINFEGIEELDEVESVDVDAIPEVLESTGPAEPARASAAAKAQPRTKKKGAAVRAQDNKPPQDEWGFFDPGQCGFEALRAKLDSPDGSPADEEETEKVAR